MPTIRRNQFPYRGFFIRAMMGLLALALFPAAAKATCPTFHTLTNGTPASATEVMDNFNYILQGCGGTTTSGGLSAIRAYTANATWAKPSGLSYVVVKVWGPGGDSSIGSWSGPGGGGGYCEKRIAAASLAATVAVTVGVHEVSNSSFGTLCIGNKASGSTGGGASGGDINISGGTGGIAGTGAGTYGGPTAIGGSAAFGGAGGIAGSTPGFPGGGGGGDCTGVDCSWNSYPGANGLVLVYEYQ